MPAPEIHHRFKNFPHPRDGRGHNGSKSASVTCVKVRPLRRRASPGAGLRRWGALGARAGAARWGPGAGAALASLRRWARGVGAELQRLPGGPVQPASLAPLPPENRESSVVNYGGPGGPEHARAYLPARRPPSCCRFRRGGPGGGAGHVPKYDRTLCRIHARRISHLPLVESCVRPGECPRFCWLLRAAGPWTPRPPFAP